MSVEHSDHRAGRWAVVAAATALIGGGVFGGLAYAGGSAHVGEPGEDGGDATCVAYQPPANEPVCNVVGEDGADGGTGTG